MIDFNMSLRAYVSTYYSTRLSVQQKYLVSQWPTGHESLVPQDIRRIRRKIVILPDDAAPFLFTPHSTYIPSSKELLMIGKINKDGGIFFGWLLVW